MTVKYKNKLGTNKNLCDTIYIFVNKKGIWVYIQNKKNTYIFEPSLIKLVKK